MTSEPSVSGGGPVVAGEPHCGVCRHVDFRDDGGPTPRCSKWNRPASIRIGEVCSSFALHPEAEIDGAEIDADVDVEVDWNEPAVGTEAPFYAVLRGDERYGWLCGNCRTIEVVVDTMGRIECTDCDNARRATEWDAAYL